MSTNLYLENTEPTVREGRALRTKMAVDFSAASSVTMPGITQTGALAITAADTSNFVPITVAQNDVTNNPRAFNLTNAGTGIGLAIGQNGNGQALVITDGGQQTSLTITKNSTGTGLSVIRNQANGLNRNVFFQQANASDPQNNVEISNVGSGAGIQINQTGTGNGLQLTQTVASNSALVPVLYNGTQTITGAVTDGYQAGLRLTPTYSAATSQTVTRHNYIDVNNVAVAGAGPAVLTDAAVLRFNAAAGTHKALDGATTKTTPGGVDAWMKINVNGTLYYMPAYTSKTA